MHTNRVKAKVDFKLCMGNIPAMLRATKPVLSDRQYKELCKEVNKVDGYLEQNVKLTMCAGKVLYEDGEFRIGEEPAVIYKKANEIIESMKD